jgi:hypothetical protein
MKPDPFDTPRAVALYPDAMQHAIWLTLLRLRVAKEARERTARAVVALSSLQRLAASRFA